MLLRYPKFADPMYSTDNHIEFDPADVMAIEQKQISLLLRGKFWATYITLKNGSEYSLNGKVGDEIEAARRRAQKSLATENSR